MSGYINKPKAAILLAVYNGEHWLNEQVSTILFQNNVNITIFTSIDISTDKSINLCKDLSKQYNNVVVLPSVDRFGGAALNFFRLIREISFSNFDYVAFSDQDDIWHSDKLSKAIQELIKNTCDGYSSNVTAFWSNGRQDLIDKAQTLVEWDYLFESAGPGCTFVMTQKLAIELQKFVRANKEAMSSVWLHDWFTYAFARAHGYKWYIDKQPSMLYRQHENNQVGVNSGYKAFLHRARFVLSGKALEQSILIARLCGLESHPFVKRWSNLSRWGMLYLAFNANKCRRKASEKIIFMFSCLLLAVIGHKKP